MSDQATVLSKNGVSLTDALQQRMVWVLKPKLTRPFLNWRIEGKSEDPVWCRVFIEQLVGGPCGPKVARILDMYENGLCDHINYVTVYWPEVTASLSEPENGGDA